MAFRTILGVLTLAALIPTLYERGRVLPLFYKNAPARLAKINAIGSYEIKFQDQIRSCEDVFLIEERHLAIMACDAGRERWNTVMGLNLPGEVEHAKLWAYDYKRTSSPDSESLTRIKLLDFPSEADFHTLGMGYDRESSTLFVTNHAKAGPRIETFKLNLDKLTATYLRTIQDPLIHGPNAIAVINSNEFYVTNAQRWTKGQSKVLNLLETYLSTATGTVVHVNIKNPQPEANIVAYLPFANGIELLNDSTVAVSASSRATVQFFNKPSATIFEPGFQLRLPFLPDNLSKSGGKLFIAGHPHLPSLAKFTHTRYICNDADELAGATADVKEFCATGLGASWVAEWSEGGGLKHLYVGTDYPTSATAAKDADKGVGIVSGLYAKGILVWRDD
ncbi:hypothetical protein EDB81DRAFT_799378 [Dactylonectria macrodidyma]|uniref:Serum paraoxonase/arylesterase n=1 Tax=Dactylonectria macrodidyma TaxID=307937 RepID=A0A9P9J4N9_9HYPO|nr:hypothetical protein EDB81DRAFT_799378 [Dactylonectria macrodidyma]